jgi:hypothetical protein
MQVEEAPLRYAAWDLAIREDLPLVSSPLSTVVCTENSIRVSESPNVGDDDRAVLPLPGPVRLAVQVEEPTQGRAGLKNLHRAISGVSA